MLVLAEELGQLVEAVGGEEQAHHLLTPLENIAAVEDAAVRDKVSVTLRIETRLTCYILGIQAVASLCNIAKVLTPQDLEKYFVPMVKRLTTGDWFTSRTSATGLYPTIYKRIPSLQSEFRTYVSCFYLLVLLYLYVIIIAYSLNWPKTAVPW